VENFDLMQYSEGSGKTLDYYDEVTKEKFVPHCIEPSLGVDRLVLALICSAYAEDSIAGEKRNFLKFHPSIAPVKAAVLPLLKNAVVARSPVWSASTIQSTYNFCVRSSTLSKYGTCT
jgi:glycyl-tRNA synthetase (class II)